MSDDQRLRARKVSDELAEQISLLREIAKPQRFPKRAYILIESIDRKQRSLDLLLRQP